MQEAAAREARHFHGWLFTTVDGQPAYVPLPGTYALDMTARRHARPPREATRHGSWYWPAGTTQPAPRSQQWRANREKLRRPMCSVGRLYWCPPKSRELIVEEHSPWLKNTTRTHLKQSPCGPHSLRTGAQPR